MRKLIPFLFLMVSQIGFAAQTSSGLYYNTFGDTKNTSVLFVHGGPGYNSWSFEFGAAQQLADAGFYVVVFDQRGSGRSATGTASDYTFVNASKDILEVIQASQANHPILIGHSWGATPAIEFLKLQPGVASGVILVEGVVSWPALFRSMLTNSETYFESQNDTADDQTAKADMLALFPNGFTAPFNFSLDDTSNAFELAMYKSDVYFPSTFTPDAQAIYQMLSARPDSQWMENDTEPPCDGFQANEKFYDEDYATDLIANKNLIYAIYSSEDGLFDPTQVGVTGGQLPSGHLTMITGAGHYSFLDQRDAFIQAVKNFAAMMAQQNPRQSGI